MSDEEYERRAANRRANNALFAKWAREDRNQVIQELIEKADAQSARVISVWLKSQMESE